MRVISDCRGSVMSRGTQVDVEEQGSNCNEMKNGIGDESNVNEDNMFYEVYAMDDSDTPEILRK